MAYSLIPVLSLRLHPERLSASAKITYLSGLLSEIWLVEGVLTRGAGGCTTLSYLARFASSWLELQARNHQIKVDRSDLATARPPS